MTDPIRAALERLAGVVQQDRERQHDTMTLIAMADPVAEALDAAHAALAQPAPPAEALAVRPLLEKVARLGDRIGGANSVGEIMAISSRAAAWLEQNPPGQPVAIEPRGCPTPGACSCVEPAPPAEGEVGGLMEELRGLADYFSGEGYSATWINLLTDTADLLAQRHPAPVPVSERLPGPEDCDAEGCIWLWDTDRRWVRQRREAASSNTWVGSSWLPAHALPLPAGEVQP